jgi:hypothetical protein
MMFEELGKRNENMLGGGYDPAQVNKHQLDKENWHFEQNSRTNLVSPQTLFTPLISTLLLRFTRSANKKVLPAWQMSSKPTLNLAASHTTHLDSYNQRMTAWTH